MNPRNPYYVLEVPLDATPGEIERHGRKILGLIELGTSRGTAYACPVGTLTRDATLVRESLAALRDPKKRAMHRCLASLLGSAPAVAETDDAAGRGQDHRGDADADAPVPDAFRIVYPGL